MFVIFNNDIEHPIKMTEGRYDYVDSLFYFKNSIREEQTEEMINYIKQLRNVTINSIEIQRRNHELIDSFTNLNARIMNINKSMETNSDGNVFSVFNVSIYNDV